MIDYSTTQFLSEQIGPGWNVSLVEDYGYAAKIHLIIDTKVTIDRIDLEANRNMSLIFLNETVLNSIKNIRYINDIVNKHNKEIDILTNDINEKAKEIERLKQYETYYRLEKEMRGKSE